MSRAARKVDRDEQLDLIFHALADRTRRGVLSMLQAGPAKITDLAAPFELSLPAVSKHIRVLEEARLIERTIDGRVHQCALAATPLHDVEKWIGTYRDFWEQSLDSLANYAARDRKRKR